MLEHRVDQDVLVTMRDGTRLAADVFRPVDGEQFPAVLTRTPYNKSWARPALASLIERGYALVTQDCRGRYKSEGEFTAFFCDLEDGYDTVEWVAAQPWCNGKVAMMGASYLGFTQLAAAMMAPPSLVTIMPFSTTSDPHQNWVYKGSGVLDLNFSVQWALQMAGEAAKRSGIHVEELDEMWRLSESLQEAMLADPDNAREILYASSDRDALDDISQSFFTSDLLRSVRGLDALIPWFFEWLEHPAMDPYWSRVAPAAHYREIVVPALHQTGWFDVFLTGGLANFTGLRAFSGSEEARAGQMIVVDRSCHGVPDLVNPNRLGDVDFGPDSHVDLLALQLRWLDHWMKGEANGIDREGPVKLFTMGTNTWREEADWPLPSTRWCTLHLTSAGGANSRAGDGRLVAQPPDDGGGASFDQWVSDPRNPVPTVGGSPIGLGAKPGPYEQGTLEDRDDVLVYTSARLAADLDVTGPVSLELWVTSRIPDAYIVAKLLDVDEDDRSVILCDGVASLAYRSSPETPIPVTPGAVYSLCVSLTATSNVFRAGHRVRLQLAASNFPHHLPVEDAYPDAGTVGEHRVFHDGQHRSALTLPVIGDLPAFES